jgi:hypothetical protein
LNIGRIESGITMAGLIEMNGAIINCSEPVTIYLNCFCASAVPNNAVYPTNSGLTFIRIA